MRIDAWNVFFVDAESVARASASRAGQYLYVNFLDACVETLDLERTALDMFGG